MSVCPGFSHNQMKMEPSKKVGFHEASVIGIQSASGIISLTLEGVRTEGGIKNVAVYLKGVEQITCDGSPIDELQMEYPDGEVLTLDSDPEAAHLIVQWNDFENHLEKTRSYDIKCQSFEVEIIPSEKPEP